MQITKCWKSVNACVHTVCMNPKAGKSDPMYPSVKLCTLITCLQSFYFTRSHHITGTIRFIFMLERQLHTCKKHVLLSHLIVEYYNNTMLNLGISHLCYSALVHAVAASLCITTLQLFLFHPFPTFAPETAIKE